MSFLKKLSFSFCLLLFFTACSQQDSDTSGSATDGSLPLVSTADLARTMVENMGGQAALENVRILVGKGDGTRTRLGQIQTAGGEDPMGTLAGSTETIDLANDLAAFDYDITIGEGGFMQHRTEVLTSYQGQPLGWANTEGRVNIAFSVNDLFSWSTQNSPEFLLRRNIITVALEALESASASEAPEQQIFNGLPSNRGTAKIYDEDVELFFNPESGLLDGFVILDTETMLGDVRAQYILGDYRAVGNLTLPHSLTIWKEGRPYSSLNYSSITVNDETALSIFDIPEDVIDEAEQVIAADGSWVPLTWEPVADKIHHIIAISHNSMVVEFDDFVAVVEGAYTEGQSLTLARQIEERIGKPIRYVVPTHPHYDHTGGLRGMAAVGATVLTAQGHEGEIRGIIESPHTSPMDELARRASAGEEVGAVEVFSGMTSVGDDSLSLVLYEVQGIRHVAPKVLAFVPESGVIFQSDLFFGGPGEGSEDLLAAIRSLGIDVKQVVGGHGPTFSFDALVSAVAGGQEP